MPPRFWIGVVNGALVTALLFGGALLMAWEW